MKHFILLYLLTTTAFIVSGCQVNWFNTTLEVAWYWIFIPAFIIFIVVYLFIIRPIYICPHCHGEIKPKWYDFSLVFHFMGKRLIKCPYCKKTSFCKIKNFNK